MSNSASNYTSLPLKTPTADAWGYLSTPSTVVDHSGVSQFGRISNGFYGVTFTSPDRFLSGAYVVIATPEYAHDTNYGPVMCRIANTAGSTALGRSAGFQLNTFENSSASTPNSLVLTDRGVTIGFAAFSFSAGRTAHISNNNKFPNPNDIFAWYSSNNGTSQNSTISRGDIQSPVGNTPLQMDITGIDPHLGTYSSSNSITKWNISPASRGQRWRVKVFVRASAPVSNGGIFIFGADNQGRTFVNGNWVELGASGNIPITTEWQEVTFAYTFTSPDVAFIQLRLDGPDSGGEGTTVWWDGLRVYEESSVDYRIVPGASAFGVTGATYNSQLTSLDSSRAATAYGTVVIPNRHALGISAGAYLENTFNVRGVSAGTSQSVFDITFEKPLNNTNYCAVLAGEYERNQDTPVVSSITSTNEFSDLLVRAGDNNRFKTVNGFRIESRKQQASDNSWSLDYASLTDPNGRTERIHFMVFGGGTYGQP